MGNNELIPACVIAFVLSFNASVAEDINKIVAAAFLGETMVFFFFFWTLVFVIFFWRGFEYLGGVGVHERGVGVPRRGY